MFTKTRYDLKSYRFQVQLSNIEVSSLKNYKINNMFLCILCGI